MRHPTVYALACACAIASGSAWARDVRVEITNLSHASYFTPLLVATHDRDTHLFQVATPASANLQAMAEGGDISGLIVDVEDAGGTAVADPAGGLLAPGATAAAELDVRGRHDTHLSIVAMILPTNDGFVGLDALRIPKRRGTFVYDLLGYDAGTEANDEIINGGGAPGVPGIPADPGGNGGVGGTGVAAVDHNTTVHVHRSVLGDTDPLGGISDVDSRVHRWLNPIARLVIHVGGRFDD